MRLIAKIKSTGDKLADALLEPLNPSGIGLMAVLLLLWGVWVASPFWDAFDSAQCYDRLDSIGPECIWGLVSITVGLVVCYGVWRPSYRALLRGSLTGLCYFLFLTGMYLSGDWKNPAWVSPLTFLLYCAWITLNIRANRHIFAIIIDPKRQ